MLTNNLTKLPFYEIKPQPHKPTMFFQQTISPLVLIYGNKVLKETSPDKMSPITFCETVTPQVQ